MVETVGRVCARMLAISFLCPTSSKFEIFVTFFLLSQALKSEYYKLLNLLLLVHLIKRQIILIG